MLISRTEPRPQPKQPRTGPIKMTAIDSNEALVFENNWFSNQILPNEETITSFSPLPDSHSLCEFSFYARYPLTGDRYFRQVSFVVDTDGYGNVDIGAVQEDFIDYTAGAMAWTTGFQNDVTAVAVRIGVDVANTQWRIEGKIKQFISAPAS